MWSLQTHIVIKVPLLVELPSWQAAEKHRNLVKNSSSVLFPEPSRETITLNPPHSREEKTLGLLTAELYFCCDLAPFEGRNKKNDHLFKVYLFLMNFHFLIISNMQKSCEHSTGNPVIPLSQVHQLFTFCPIYLLFTLCKHFPPEQIENKLLTLSPLPKYVSVFSRMEQQSEAGNLTFTYCYLITPYSDFILFSSRIKVQIIHYHVCLVCFNLETCLSSSLSFLTRFLKSRKQFGGCFWEGEKEPLITGLWLATIS